MASTYYYDGEIRINSSIEADGFEAGGKEIEAAARRMSRSISKMGDTAKIAMQKQTNAFIKQNQAYENQRKKVEKLNSTLKEMASQKVATDEYSGISKQIDKDTAKLNHLEEIQERFLRAGGKTQSSAYRKRKLEIEELRNSIRYAKGEQDSLLQSGTAYKNVDTSGMQQKLASEQQKLARMSQTSGASWQSLKAKVVSYNGTLNETVSWKKRLKTAFKGLLAPVTKLGKGMFGVEKHSKRTNLTMGRMLRTSLLLGLAFRIFSAIASAIGKGFSNLAQFSTGTNKEISALMSALTRLKNSFATAFSPILSIVNPVLISFINTISKALTYIGMFFAALTGQKSFTKAVDVQEDYAAGLSGTADAAKDAAKAQNSYLSGLDEITRFESDKSGASSSGGGGGVGVSEMFEEVEIPSTFTDLAQKVKEVFEPIIKLFQDFGGKIKEATAQWSEDLDWTPLLTSLDFLMEKLEPLVALLLDGFAWAYINLLLPFAKWTIEEALPKLIETLGKAFEFVSAAIEFLIPILEFLWKNILEPFRDACGEIAIDIIEVFGGLLDFLTGIFTGDWEKAFEGLETILMSFYDACDTIFSFVKNYIFTPFDKWLTGIFTADWTKAFGIAGEVANGLLISLNGIWTGIKQILEGIVDFVAGVFTGDWSRAWNGIKKIFSGVFNSLVSIVKTPINLIIGCLNSLIGGVVAGINAVIGGLNKLNIKLPEWLKYVPGVSALAGKSLGFNIAKMSAPKIPYLATGAVIPPNAPFMAVLGDQKQGTNIETPEALLRKIIREENANQRGTGGTYTFVGQINRRIVFEEVIAEAKVMQMITGKNPFELA